MQETHEARPEPHQLFRRENLRFLTKEEGREPTLYFIDGNKSGRIRQQHHRGPKVKEQHYKKDYFFDSQSDLNRFKNIAREAHERKIPWNSQITAHLKFNETFKSGDWHAEIYFKEDSEYIRTLHFSAGRVNADLREYDDQRIATIYRAVNLFHPE
jgi:hypothetical protein